MLLLVATHVAIGGLGFMAGIYVLPILIAPDAPDTDTLKHAMKQSRYLGRFERDRKGSDAFHWGEGELSIGPDAISFMGELAPGPDYKLYLSPEFVETKEAFNSLKSEMVLVGDVKTFSNFIVSLPEEIDPAQYNTVVVWCESFGQFITSASYTARAGEQ